MRIILKKLSLLKELIRNFVLIFFSRFTQSSYIKNIGKNYSKIAYESFWIMEKYLGYSD